MKILAEPIEAAVWFKAKEKPFPIKFRYLDKEGILCKVNVDSIIRLRKKLESDTSSRKSILNEIQINNIYNTLNNYTHADEDKKQRHIHRLKESY